MKITLHGATLEELEVRVSEEYGHKARIVDAALVTVGGIGGFLARKHYEVTVEVPDSGEHFVDSSTPAPFEPAEPAQPVPPRSGIAALLADADHTESRIHSGTHPDVSVSTSSPSFNDLIDGLVTSTGAAVPATQATRAPAVPYPASGSGDLTLIVGLGDDALTVALSMHAYAAGPVDPVTDVYTAGMLHRDPFKRVKDRVAVTGARAVGVETGRPVFIAYGIGRGETVDQETEHVRKVAADQVWVAVDAGRKPADTRIWVSTLAETIDIAGVAVEGADATATPETVNELLLPIGWLRGKPARATTI